MSDSSSRLVAAADTSSWDTLGYNTLPTSRSSSQQRPRRGFVTKHVFQSLAALLIVSLCVLLAELQSPGVMNHVGRSMRTYWQWKPDKEPTIAIKSKSYYSPVPAPFLSPKSSNFMERVPSSESTMITSREFFDVVVAPTSEPTGTNCHFPFVFVV